MWRSQRGRGKVTTVGKLEFCRNSTGLERMASMMHHFENSKWYKARYILVERFNQPSDLKPGQFVHTLEFVRHV